MGRMDQRNPEETRGKEAAAKNELEAKKKKFNNNIGAQLENVRKKSYAREEAQDYIEGEVAQMKVKSKEKFLQQWQQKKQEYDQQEKIILRDPKAKLITFEMVSISKFSVSLNFFMPEDLVLILKKHGGAYDFNLREWIVSLNKYKEIAIDISLLCRAKIIDLDPIPQVSFDILEYRIPFTDDTKTNVVGYDYSLDLTLKPSISQLPPSLLHSLYNFQKVGVQFGVDHFGRILLGDEMGVGKTI